ncbi:hypothetical protein [Streptomyces sp. NPDC015130]|uniref:hypothetical protein n=1 Tax=Streptomyces sp. NPDC015130 TaxID=3364940 RepID=UPI0036FC704D
MEELGIIDSLSTKAGTGSLTADEQARHESGRRTAANLILTNPDCFDRTERATAQSIRDQLSAERQSQDLDDLRRSVCAASDEPWWECAN